MSEIVYDKKAKCCRTQEKKINSDILEQNKSSQ